MPNVGAQRIQTARCSCRVEVVVGGRSIAESSDTVLLYEAGHEPVYYFPVTDVDLECLTPTDLTTHCPYKGEASYWTIRANEVVLENSVWCYKEPLESVGEIAGMLAFYQHRVDEVGSFSVAD